MKIVNENNFDVDRFSTLDLSRNILISSSQKDNQYIKLNSDGSFSIKNDNDINLVGRKLYNQSHNLVNINYKPRLKIVCPKGYIPLFYSPNNINFYYKVFKSFDIIEYYTNENSDYLTTSIPNVLIYHNIEIEVIVDLNQFKDFQSTFQLNKGVPILSFVFNRIQYPIKNFKLPEIQDIYWLQHTEIYNELLKCI